MHSVLLFFVLLQALFSSIIASKAAPREDDSALETCGEKSNRRLKWPLLVSSSFHLVHLLLLVEADLAGTHVDEEEQTADNGEDLEEVVLGEVFVGVVLVEL